MWPWCPVCVLDAGRELGGGGRPSCVLFQHCLQRAEPSVEDGGATGACRLPAQWGRASVAPRRGGRALAVSPVSRLATKWP